MKLTFRGVQGPFEVLPSGGPVSALVFDSVQESNIRTMPRIHRTPYGVNTYLRNFWSLFLTVPGPVYSECMGVKIPAEVRAAMTEIAREFGRQGGKKAARNATPEERSARAKIASLAAAEKRTAKRLAAEAIKREKKAEKKR